MRYWSPRPPGGSPSTLGSQPSCGAARAPDDRAEGQHPAPARPRPRVLSPSRRRPSPRAGVSVRRRARAMPAGPRTRVDSPARRWGRPLGGRPRGFRHFSRPPPVSHGATRTLSCASCVPRAPPPPPLPLPPHVPWVPPPSLLPPQPPVSRGATTNLSCASCVPWAPPPSLLAPPPHPLCPVGSITTSPAGWTQEGTRKPQRPSRWRPCHRTPSNCLRLSLRRS